MIYKVLSPWADVDYSEAKALVQHPANLEGKTVGMFSHFKEHSGLMLKIIAKMMAERIPNVRFKYLQYPKDTQEIFKDPQFDPILREWLQDVDVVLSAYGDAGSCAMFQAYNTAYVEKLGVPTVMLTKSSLLNAAQSGARARLVPRMRFVTCEISDLSHIRSFTEEVIEREIRPHVAPHIDQIIEALTAPLTEDEAKKPEKPNDLAHGVFSGDLNTINDLFYRYGWTNGTPIIPPTREAVDAMLEGTDLPADYVVGRIPPMLGEATVEKIAINGVMAGCLPTYMPILIAAVRGMLDSRIHLEGWTCSISSWAPLIVVSGPIVREINMHAERGQALSPYYKAGATIARAIAYMIMNIGGIRPSLEDASELGHENRLGICIGENMESSPWQPLHVDYGFEHEDSAVTMFWPKDAESFFGAGVEHIMKGLCAIRSDGWAPGAGIIMTPGAAKHLADAGWTKNQVLDYIVEYNRIPGSQINVRWMHGNNHVAGNLPDNVSLPISAEHSTRRFWTKEHLFIAIGGGSTGSTFRAFTGGGDHGGPSCTKVELPADWDNLKAKYSGIDPEYVNY